MKKKIVIGVFLLILIVVVVLIVKLYGAPDQTVSTPQRGSIIEAVYGLGVVESENIYPLKVGTTTRLEDIFVFEGQSVKKGERLLAITSNVIFKSPIDGVVTSLDFHKGETIFPNVPILQVTDLQKRYILVSLDQESIMRVRVGQPVKLSFESLRGQKFTGSVANIYPKNGEFLVRINIQNLPLEILPDMTADVAIEMNKKDNALLIPLIAITNGKVVVRRNHRHVKIPVTIGLVDGSFAEVLSGDLTEQDQIVLPKK